MKKLAMINEQLSIGAVNKHSGLPKRGACKQRHCSLFIANYSLLIALLLFASCDLLTSPKVDLFQQISDEVDWANAEKLTVRFEYPSVWGTSNPVQGSLTPAMDIRKGYEFSVEFKPDGVYTVRSWQVYLTEALDGISGKEGQPGNWLEYPSLISEQGIEPLGLMDKDGVKQLTLPTITSDNAQGGTYKFTINITKPVTLVPWCETQPRITKAEPRNPISGNLVPRTSTIVLYFNSTLNDETVKFAKLDPDTVEVAPDKIEETNGIWIMAERENNGVTVKKYNEVEKWYNAPEFVIANGFFMVTISPSSNLPPDASKMTVKVRGIKDTNNVSIEGVYRFSWDTKPASTSAYFNSWDAEYTDSDSIEVNYSNVGENNVKMYYRLNRGVSTEFNKTIYNVPSPDISGVREGTHVSGIREYEIILELYAGGLMEDRASFKIWNIPGMKVSDDNPVMEIRTAEELAAMKDNLSGQYVLANDVTITGKWAPISTDGPFVGKFYGNGRTITIKNGFLTGITYVGIFSNVNNALISDLVLVYADTTFIGTGNVTYVGGIAGYVQGNTEIRNCIVRGATTDDNLTVLANANTWLGGITGNMNIFDNSTACINNCHIALNVTLNNDIGNNNLHVGSVVGASYSTGTLTDISSTAVVSMNKTKGEEGYDYCGGIVGLNNSTNLTRCVFSGKINIPVNFYANDGMSFIGGLIGSYEKGITDDCSVTGDIFVHSSGKTIVNLGGVVGFITGTIDSSITTRITNTIYSFGSIQFIESSQLIHDTTNIHRIGGFVGWISDCVSFYNCHSNATHITAQVSESPLGIYVGGFAGMMTGGGGNVSQCDSTSQVIVPASHASTGLVSVGGFIGNMVNSNNGSIIENCFAMGSVTVYCSNTGSQAGNSIGGFIGATMSNESEIPSTIRRCYATGDVLAINHADIYSGTAFNVGGLVGWANGLNISECYAKGNVTARKGSGGNMAIYAGGLVGYLGYFVSYGPTQKSSIIDCYAKGNVTADNPNADNASVYAGGLVGYMQVEYAVNPLTGIVTRSFASGTVIAKNASDGTGSDWRVNVWAGGIVGYKASGNLQQCVAAGRPSQLVSISAQGGENRYVGRIYGQSSETPPADNYANVAILTGIGTGNGTSADGYYTNPTLNVVTSTNAASADGATATNSQLSNSSFWMSSPLLFNTNRAWNFAPVSQGWPVLANVGGNQ